VDGTFELYGMGVLREWVNIIVIQGYTKAALWKNKTPKKTLSLCGARMDSGWYFNVEREKKSPFDT
jgi:hypothetical protein